MGTFHKVVILTGFLFSFSVHATMSEFANPTAGKQTVQSCQSFMASGKCDKFQGQPGALKPDQCQAEVNGDNWSVLSRLANCGSGIKLSAGTLWENIKSIGSSTISAAGGIYNYLTDSDSRAATHESMREAWKASGEYLESVYPYIAVEFQKAMTEANKKGGDPNANALQAATSMAPRLMGKLMSAAMEIIKSKYEEFHCFDNNKQVEMVCKVAADLLMPPTAIFTLYKAGVKGLAQLPKVTSKLEEMLKVGTKAEKNAENAASAKENAVKAKDKISDAAKKLEQMAVDAKATAQDIIGGPPKPKDISSATARAPTTDTMTRLQNSIDAKFSGNHKLTTDANGVTTLKIGHMRRSQRDFMVSATKAMREGKVQVLDAGNVVGPKALTGIHELSKTVNKGNPNGVKFHGVIHGDQLKTSYKMQTGIKREAIREDGTSNPEFWTRSEIRRFNKALKEMKLDEACRQYYGNGPCLKMAFEFDSRYPGNIRWMAIEP